MGGSGCSWNYGWRAWDLTVLVLGPLQVPIWGYISVWTLLLAYLIMTRVYSSFRALQSRDVCATQSLSTSGRLLQRLNESPIYST